MGLLDFFSGIVKGLSKKPAYLLVFALAVAPVLTGADLWFGVVTLTVAVLVVWIVEIRTVRVGDKAQKARFEDAGTIPRESAAHSVLHSATDNGVDLYVTYSSTEVEKFINRRDSPIDNFPFHRMERQVTAIPDAQGIAYLHGLLSTAGKWNRVHVITSDQFQDDFWNHNVILIGSPNSNDKTNKALEWYHCPFTFSDDVDAILDRDDQSSSWPKQPADLAKHDYAILAVMHMGFIEEQPRVCVVAAGLGGFGTLAACYWLADKIVDLHERFGDSPFACLLHIDREIGFTSAEEVQARRLPSRPRESATARTTWRHKAR